MPDGSASSTTAADRVVDEIRAAGGQAVASHDSVATPAGGAAIVEFRVNSPGTYILVDHSLTRAFNKGALGQLKVTGDDVKVALSLFVERHYGALPVVDGGKVVGILSTIDLLRAFQQHLG